MRGAPCICFHMSAVMRCGEQCERQRLVPVSPLTTSTLHCTRSAADKLQDGRYQRYTWSNGQVAPVRSYPLRWMRMLVPAIENATVVCHFREPSSSAPVFIAYLVAPEKDTVKTRETHQGSRITINVEARENVLPWYPKPRKRQPAPSAPATVECIAGERTTHLRPFYHSENNMTKYDCASVPKDAPLATINRTSGPFITQRTT